ncbi:hydroxymethylbilane synthase [Halobacteriales archaeon QS_8_69_26]|nr:MAG: hydroxymethylbilane synthase [Halobacteriales archaeon QS_8_69_26]
MARPTVRLATRGSDLAMRQTAQVAEALEDRRFEVEVVQVSTRGDEVRDELIHRLGKTGAFVRSLDERVLSGEADAAVHSMKDVPTESPEELVVAAVPERGPPGDVLVTPDGRSLSDLPEGATVGTSSLRRRAQLLAHRPDLTVEPLRGNVDTRVEKLLAPHLQREHERRLGAEESAQDPEAGAADGTDEDAVDGNGDAGATDDATDGSDDGSNGDAEAETDNATDGSDDGSNGDAEAETDDEAGNEAYDRTAAEWFEDLSEVERRAMERTVDVEFDAIVLAEVGLRRLGLADDLDTDRLPPDEFVPAPGQGAMAVTALDADLAERIHGALDHPRSRVETTVERTVLATLGGGCVAPIGVHAVLQGEHVRTVAAALGRDGEAVVRGTRNLPVERHAEAAREFARDLDEEGAGELVAAARAETDDREAKREGSEE